MKINVSNGPRLEPIITYHLEYNCENVVDVALLFIRRINYFKMCKIEKQKGRTIGRKKLCEREKACNLFAISVCVVHGPLIMLGLKYFFQLNQISMDRKIFKLIDDNSKNQLNPPCRG